MPGRVYNILIDRALDQYGLITPEDALNLAVDPQRLVEMARRGAIERIDRGVYRFNVVPRTGREQLMEAVLWPHTVRGVISHDTALDAYDLCDINPAKIHLTVPRRHRITRRVPDVLTIHERDLSPNEVSVWEGIPMVTPARALIDGIETNIAPRLIRQAIENARRRGLIRPRDLDRIEARRVRAPR